MDLLSGNSIENLNTFKNNVKFVNLFMLWQLLIVSSFFIYVVVVVCFFLVVLAFNFVVLHSFFFLHFGWRINQIATNFSHLINITILRHQILFV